MYWFEIKLISSSNIIKKFDFFGSVFDVQKEIKRLLEKYKGYYTKYDYNIVTTLH